MNVVNHLSILESAGLVSLTQVSPDVEYLFRHTLVQEAAYASLLDEDVSRLHYLVGEAIETLYPDRLDEMAPSLGRHFDQAGDYKRAALYYERAGKKALETYSHQEAAGHFRKALDLTQDSLRHASLLAGLGESLALMGQSEEAIRVWKEGIARFKQIGDMENTAYLYARAGRVAWFSKDQRLGMEICEEGMGVVQGAPESHGLALLMHETARAYFFNGRQDEALPLCKQALKMAERLGAVNVQAESLSTLGILPQVPAEERMALLKQAVELAESAGMLHIASRAHLNLGSAYIHQFGDHETGRQHYQTAADLARRCAVTQSELFYLTAVAEISLGMGDLDEVERISLEMERLAEMLPDQNVAQIEFKIFRLWPRAYRGHWDEIFPILKEQIIEARAAGNAKQQVDYCLTAARALIELHRLGKPVSLAEAYAYTQEALENVPNSELAAGIPIIKAIAALLKAYQGHLSEANHQMEEVNQSISGDDPYKKKDYVQSLILEMACLEGSWSKAINIFRQLSQDHKNLSVFDWARNLLLTADAYLKRGEPDDLEEAQGLLQEAGAIYTKLQAPIYLEQVEELVKKARAQTFAQAAAQRQVAKELAQAGRLQSSFLPEEPPAIPGWQIAARLHPARQTSGDYYDFIPLPDGKLGIVIADVADKGIGAALFMTSSRSLLRAYAAANVDSPEVVLREANQRITQDIHGGLFITLFYGVLDPRNSVLAYCNAGHNPPYLLSIDHQVQPLSKTGIPLGVFPDATWHTNTVNLPTGSLLALYTDGVTEAISEAGELFGEDRLLNALANATSAAAESAEDSLQVILDHVDRFRGKTALTDDLTLVVLKHTF